MRANLPVAGENWFASASIDVGSADLDGVSLLFQPGAPVKSGDIIGSIEGFKAISDLYCAADGRFLGGNPALRESAALVAEDPYGAGWLFRLEANASSNTASLLSPADYETFLAEESK